MRYEIRFDHTFYVEVPDDLEETELDRRLDEACADELLEMALPCYEAYEAPKRTKA